MKYANLNPDLTQYGYYLFDWDGCLAMTLHAALKAHRDSFADYDAYPTDAEIASQFGDMRAPEFFGIKDSEGCWKAFYSYLEEAVKEVELYEGAREALHNARQNGRVAIVSSQKDSILHNSLARHGVEHLVDVVITGGDVAEHKPHPEALEKALSHFNAKPDQAVMFGDSDKDVRAAHSAGVHSVLMYPESHSVFYDFQALSSHKPTYIAKGMHEVVDWF